MQALFQFDLRGLDYAGELDATTTSAGVDAVCRAELRRAAEDSDSPDPLDEPQRKLNAGEREILQFATKLVEGTLERRDEIDARLQSVTRNWDLRRMAIVDRNILRMAVYELMWCDDVPHKVAINEAIELGKKFSTANSGGFVNGILDRIRMDIERSAAEGADDVTSTD